MQIYREMEMDKVEITAKDIIDKYLGRDTKPKIMLLDVFREHNDRCQKLADASRDMATATVMRYETSLSMWLILLNIDKEIKVERMAQVKDAFLFCCFTGLAFSDVKGLRPEHIVKDNNGSLWIRKPRQKTRIMCNIPLLDVPKQILEKYKDHPVCVKQGALLPVPCNQKMNAYLKELADLCGINKEISTHTGRHSFATSIALANGVSIENAAKMLGHSDTKMTRHYARILDKSIKKDMDEVQKALSSYSIAN